MVERDHKLSLLLDVGAMLAREVELDALLEMLGSRVAAALHAGVPRSTWWTPRPASSGRASRTCRSCARIRLPPGKGIAGYVADHGEIVNVRDVARDERHFAGIDRETGFSTRTVLAAPIVDKQRAIRGVVQALNKREGEFTDEDEVFLATLATQVAQAFESTTLRPAPEATRGVSLRGPLNHVVGTSPAMRLVYEQILQAAATEATVLLRGETGVGGGSSRAPCTSNRSARTGPESSSNAPPSRAPSPRASFSATSEGPTRARTAGCSARWSSRTAGRCSSTRSAISR